MGFEELVDPKMLFVILYLLPGYLSMRTWFWSMKMFIPLGRIQWTNLKTFDKIIGSVIWSTVIFSIFALVLHYENIGSILEQNDTRLVFTILGASIFIGMALSEIFAFLIVVMNEYIGPTFEFLLISPIKIIFANKDELEKIITKYCEEESSRIGVIYNGLLRLIYIADTRKEEITITTANNKTLTGKIESISRDFYEMVVLSNKKRVYVKLNEIVDLQVSNENKHLRNKHTINALKKTLTNEFIILLVATILLGRNPWSGVLLFCSTAYFLIVRINLQAIKTEA